MCLLEMHIRWSMDCLKDAQQLADYAIQALAMDEADGATSAKNFAAASLHRLKEYASASEFIRKLLATRGESDSLCWKLQYEHGSRWAGDIKAQLETGKMV